MSKTIRVIAAHPDDEALGCGGTILKHKKNGDHIAFLWMTNGLDARQNTTSQDESNRKKGHQAALEFLSPTHYRCENFPDNQLDQVSLISLVKSIETFIKKVKPDIIYTHFYNDLNVDHSLTCRAVMTATRPGSSTFVPEIYSFEVASSTEWAVGDQQFSPDTYSDISQHIKGKIEYLKCYEDEMRAMPHPRSIENIIALNQVKGASMNLQYAEAFITMRRVMSHQI
jgi:LmbE family N-acetylglucosaminyl deacetylase